MRGSQVRTLSGTQKFSKTERFIPKNGYICKEKLKQTLLAQMVVAVVLHTTGHRFEPCRVYKKGGIGRVLIVSVKHRLGGSIPSAPTTKWTSSSVAEQRAVNSKVVGSTPT